MSLRHLTYSSPAIISPALLHCKEQGKEGKREGGRERGREKLHKKSQKG